MDELISTNKRIAKNTLFLYLRMFVYIIVNLYTIRVLWKVLGIDDYGIYNVVGGIVLMFSFLNNAMVASSQRFISFELGRGNKERLRKTFSISIIVHFYLAIAVLILAETIGLWFLNSKMNIPAGRIIAANWVYQCSIIAFIINVISVPYNACIVAHEHMKIYGYFGIIDVFLRLIVVLITALMPFDHLISYSFLIMLLSISWRIIYSLYCRKHFEECSFQKTKDKGLIKDMFSFAGWSFLGTLGFSVRDQGSNIIINMFFNVAVNAAKGIANQIGTVINSFANNFTMALNPQITKRYAAGQIGSMIELMMNGCKYSIILMSFIVIPLFFSAPVVLNLWLVNVAQYTVGFLRLILIMALIDSSVSPITTALQSTGKIKKFQIIISIIMISSLPLSWLCLKIEKVPYVVLWIAIVTSIVALIYRIILLHDLIDFSYKRLVSKVYSRTIPFILISFFIGGYLYPIFKPNLIGTLGYFFSIWLLNIILIYIIALTKREQSFIIKTLNSKFK